MKALFILAAISILAGVGASADPVSASSPTAKEIVEKSQAAYAALSSYSSAGQTVSTLGAMTQATTFTIRLQRPSLYRIDWKSGFSSGSVWSAGTGDFLQLIGLPQKMQSREMALGGATGVSGMASATIPGTFFKQNWGNALNPGLPLERKPDEKVGAFDCFVVSSQIAPKSGGTMTTTLWIGQQDGLIHQSRTETEGLHQPEVKLTDEQVGEALKMQNKPVTPETIAAMRVTMAEGMKSARKMMEGKSIMFTQVQTDISINKSFVAADFGHP
jgi:hypothetical protein